VYVAFCTVHGVIGGVDQDGKPTAVHLHHGDAAEDAHAHNVPEPCTCFVRGEYSGRCARHGDAA
jgi:hypothetical protein